MQAQYEVWLVDQNGARMSLLDTDISFAYTKATHSLGFFSVMLPGKFERGQLLADNRVLFYRKPDGATMALDYVGIIRAVRTKTDVSGQTVRIIEGHTPNHLLEGRIIRAAAGTAQAGKTDYVDDMMKEIVYEQCGGGAGTRAYSSTYFSVQGDDSAGPSLTRAFSNRNVLDVLRELNEASRQAGTEIFFDVACPTETTFQFITATQQIGRDLTTTGAVFGLEFGNLRDGELSEDWRDEINTGYGLGAGTGSGRYVGFAQDTNRSGRTWYSRREATKDARGESNAGATATAQSLITERRPVTTFTGALLSVPGSQYGVDWRWGDRITVTYDGRTFPAIIRTVTVSVDESGKERIDCRLEAYL